MFIFYYGVIYKDRITYEYMCSYIAFHITCFHTCHTSSIISTIIYGYSVGIPPLASPQLHPRPPPPANLAAASMAPLISPRHPWRRPRPPSCRRAPACPHPLPPLTPPTPSSRHAPAIGPLVTKVSTTPYALACDPMPPPSAPPVRVRDDRHDPRRQTLQPPPPRRQPLPRPRPVQPWHPPPPPSPSIQHSVGDLFSNDMN
jgi:hypothetical protein